jgi:ABC-type uncharacterized transport system ATPase subunit
VAVAIRDAEARTRFIGYRVERVKLAIFTFSAMLAGIAGALYVPQVGIINPGEFSPLNSIELVIWVAIGGRATLYGAVIGAMLVNYGKTYFTGAFPEAWLFALGALFVSSRSSCPRASPALVGMILNLATIAPRRIRSGGGAMKPVEQLRESMRKDRQWSFMYSMLDLELDVSQGVILYLEDVSVSFDGFKAINNLNFYVNAGELRCVIGPNGAGKTTMMDIITGKTRPDTGSAYFGRTIDLLRPLGARDRRARHRPQVPEADGLRVPQRLREPGARYGRRQARLPDPVRPTLGGEQRDRIDEVLGIIGLQEQAGREAGCLSHGQKQWLEIGMLLMQDPHLLLVDEPVAGMTHQEMDRTAELLLSLEGKHSVVVVEHDMDFVRSIAKRVTVLHQGSVLAEGSMDEVQNDPRVVEVYLGE